MVGVVGRIDRNTSCCRLDGEIRSTRNVQRVQRRSGTKDRQHVILKTEAVGLGQTRKIDVATTQIDRSTELGWVVNNKMTIALAKVYDPPRPDTSGHMNIGRIRRTGCRRYTGVRCVG